MANRISLSNDLAKSVSSLDSVLSKLTSVLGRFADGFDKGGNGKSVFQGSLAGEALGGYIAGNMMRQPISSKVLGNILGDDVRFGDAMTAYSKHYTGPGWINPKWYNNDDMKVAGGYLNRKGLFGHLYNDDGFWPNTKIANRKGVKGLLGTMMNEGLYTNESADALTEMGPDTLKAAITKLATPMAALGVAVALTTTAVKAMGNAANQIAGGAAWGGSSGGEVIGAGIAAGVDASQAGQSLSNLANASMKGGYAARYLSKLMGSPWKGNAVDKLNATQYGLKALRGLQGLDPETQRRILEESGSLDLYQILRTGNMDKLDQFKGTNMQGDVGWSKLTSGIKGLWTELGISLLGGLDNSGGNDLKSAINKNTEALDKNTTIQMNGYNIENSMGLSGPIPRGWLTYSGNMTASYQNRVRIGIL